MPLLLKKCGNAAKTKEEMHHFYQGMHHFYQGMHHFYHIYEKVADFAAWFYQFC